MGIHGPCCETSLQCIQVCSFSHRCGTWICSHSCKNLTTLKGSAEDQSEGCWKLVHLGPFSIFLSEGMGMDIPENSVEYKIILIFGLYLPQIDMMSFLRGPFALWIDQFTNKPGLTLCWVLLNNTLVLLMDQYVTALLNKQVTSPKMRVPLANS